MKLSTPKFVLMAAVAMSSWAIAADSTTPSVTPDEALSRLKAGNERFAQSKVSTGKPVAARQSSRSADHREVGPETDEA
jgi:hypothetical protein